MSASQPKRERRATTARGQRTKSRLEAAARALASEGGSVSFEAVAHRAEVHPSLVAYYFKSAAALREAAGIEACPHCGGSGRQAGKVAEKA